LQEQDSELMAMASIIGILNDLNEEARFRVLRYATERFGLAEPIRQADELDLSAPSTDSLATGAFPDFATLFDAVNPTSGAMRALVAGYWLQACKGQAEFDGQSVNNELKNLGHPSRNITSDLSALMNQTPRLAMQLRKSGRSQQARKTYKLTIEGLRRTKSLLSGADPSPN
jgi:hypothetical protein